MDDLSQEYSDARKTVSLDLRHGYFVVWGILVTAVWLVALALVWIVATRFSRPIVNLTEALRALAGGDFRIRSSQEQPAPMKSDWPLRPSTARQQNWNTAGTVWSI